MQRFEVTSSIFLILFFTMMIPSAYAGAWVNVDSTYIKGEQIVLAGDTDSWGPEVVLQIIKDGQLLDAAQVSTTSSGDFAHMVNTNGDRWPLGEYEVRAFHDDEMSNYNFKLIEGILPQIEVQNENSDSSESVVVNEGLQEQKEMVLNWDFENGLSSWNTGIFDYNPEDRPYFKDEYHCTTVVGLGECRAEGWGYPQFGVSDDRTPGDKEFYAFVPAFANGARTAAFVSQDINIPKSDSVTLSFMVIGFHETQVHIFVTNRDTGSEDLFARFVVSDNWNGWGSPLEREYNFTKYAGQPITLKFVASQTTKPNFPNAENLETAVYLDAISVKATTPWTPPSRNIDFESFWWGIVGLVVAGGIVGIVLATRKKDVTVEQEPTKKSTPTVPTHGTLPKGIEKPEESIEEKPILESNKPVQDTAVLSDDDYQKAIHNSLALRSLWSLLHAPANRYDTVNKLYESLGDEVDHRKQHNKICDELADLDLIKKHNLSYSYNKKYEYYTPLLSDLGEKLIKLARKEKIFTWTEFLEKFHEHLETEDE